MFKHELKESDPYRFRGTGEFTIEDPDDENSELAVDVEECGEEVLLPSDELAEDEDDF